MRITEFVENILNNIDNRIEYIINTFVIYNDDYHLLCKYLHNIEIFIIERLILVGFDELNKDSLIFNLRFDTLVLHNCTLNKPFEIINPCNLKISGSSLFYGSEETILQMIYDSTYREFQEITMFKDDEYQTNYQNLIDVAYSIYLMNNAFFKEYCWYILYYEQNINKIDLLNLNEIICEIMEKKSLNYTQALVILMICML